MICATGGRPSCVLRIYFDSGFKPLNNGLNVTWLYLHGVQVE